MAHPHPWADALKALPTVTLWEVTMENRDEMPQRVCQWIERAARR
jgi:nucleoside-triphosphatase THEP1